MGTVGMWAKDTWPARKLITRKDKFCGEVSASETAENGTIQLSLVLITRNGNGRSV